MNQSPDDKKPRETPIFTEDFLDEIDAAYGNLFGNTMGTFCDTTFPNPDPPDLSSGTGPSAARQYVDMAIREQLIKVTAQLEILRCHATGGKRWGDEVKELRTTQRAMVEFLTRDNPDPPGSEYDGNNHAQRAVFDQISSSVIKYLARRTADAEIHSSTLQRDMMDRALSTMMDEMTDKRREPGRELLEITRSAIEKLSAAHGWPGRDVSDQCAMDAALRVAAQHQDELYDASDPYCEPEITRDHRCAVVRSDTHDHRVREPMPLVEQLWCDCRRTGCPGYREVITGTGETLPDECDCRCQHMHPSGPFDDDPNPGMD